jgi:hypothetical protein
MSAIEQPAARSGRTPSGAAAQDVGALGHEVHAAEDHELGRVPRGCRARELQRVAGEVGELDHFVALIVMAEDDETIAERPLRGGDPRVHLVVGETQECLGNRLALADALFLDLREEFNVHLYPRGFAPRTPLHALSRAASPARSDPRGSRRGARSHHEARLATTFDDSGSSASGPVITLYSVSRS